MISIVVATDKNNIIGQENKIPWRLRADLKNLVKLTKGHTVIMGRVTYDSMAWYYDKSGRDMPAKTYIIVTRNTDYQPARPNTRVVHSIPEAIELAQSLGDDDIFVLGGGGIYKAMLPYTDRIHRTEVQAEAVGDVYFPELKSEEWQEVSHQHHQKDEANEYDFDFVILERTHRAN